MNTQSKIEQVAVVGTGLIGSSWTALFLARGLRVSATDPAPNAERELRAQVEGIWPVLEKIGLSPGASPDRLAFSRDLATAVSSADFVQENGPERMEYKVRMFADLDAILPPKVILASSTSGLTMSQVQAECRHPARCVIGHPFNPPHLIPLVEVVGGAATSADTVERAEAFYTWLGKRAIRLHKEVPGHVANRLQAALWREAVHLVAEGVVSVTDVDAAVSWGPGLRWGAMGPNLIFHLGGGTGGIEHFMHHLSGPFASWWDDLGRPVLDPQLKAKIIQGVHEESGGRSISELAAERDDIIVNLITMRQEREHRQPRSTAS